MLTRYRVEVRADYRGWVLVEAEDASAAEKMIERELDGAVDHFWLTVGDMERSAEVSAVEATPFEDDSQDSNYVLEQAALVRGCLLACGPRIRLDFDGIEFDEIEYMWETTSYGVLVLYAEAVRRGMLPGSAIAALSASELEADFHTGRLLALYKITYPDYPIDCECFFCDWEWVHGELSKLIASGRPPWDSDD